jgi:hypothetical protein
VERSNVGELVDLRTERRERRDAAYRSQLGQHLQGLGSQVISGDFDAGSPYAVVTVVLTDNGPQVAACGLQGRGDLALLGWTLRAMNQSYELAELLDQTTGWDPNEELLDRYEGHRDRASLRALADQAGQDAKPWYCEHCERRFGTERGANTHERNCRYNPGAKRYGPDGTYDPVLRDDGRVKGWQRRSRSHG